MSANLRRKRRRRSETSAMQILEEAFHLLRTVDVKHFWIFYAGAVPFAIAMLYYVADMSRSSQAREDAVFAAIAMGGFFFWMKFTKAKFCAGLWDTISPIQIDETPGRGGLARVGALFLLQALQIPILVVASFFLIPFGWAFAMIENVAALSFTQTFRKRPLRELFGTSLRYSHHEWAQNHGILVILTFIGLFTFLNVVATCVMIPTFGKSFFGIESIFTLNPITAVMNTTFLLGSTLITWLVLSPIIKAVYVLRCFYAESRTSGADLLSRLAMARAKRGKNQRSEAFVSNRAACLGGIFFVIGMSFAQPLIAQDEERNEVVAMREGITETMEKKKYQWKLSRLEIEAETLEDKSWLALRLDEIAEAVSDGMKKFGDWVDAMIKKLTKGRVPTEKSDSKFNTGFFRDMSSTMSIALVLIILALLGWLVFVVYRKYQSAPKVEKEEEGVSGPIDLESEDIVASQLPEDEWMRLAREQIAKGDSRLAVRALFLATLAHLGDKELLRIARFKSNRDYVRELALKARTDETLRAAFDENTNLFEKAWYGLHQLGEGAVEHFLANHETITRESERSTLQSAAVN